MEHITIRHRGRKKVIVTIVLVIVLKLASPSAIAWTIGPCQLLLLGRQAGARDDHVIVSRPRNLLCLESVLLRFSFCQRHFSDFFKTIPSLRTSMPDNVSSQILSGFSTRRYPPCPQHFCCMEEVGLNNSFLLTINFTRRADTFVGHVVRALVDFALVSEDTMATVLRGDASVLFDQQIHDQLVTMLVQVCAVVRLSSWESDPPETVFWQLKKIIDVFQKLPKSTESEWRRSATLVQHLIRSNLLAVTLRPAARESVPFINMTGRFSVALLNIL